MKRDRKTEQDRIDECREDRSDLGLDAFEKGLVGIVGAECRDHRPDDQEEDAERPDHHRSAHRPREFKRDRVRADQGQRHHEQGLKSHQPVTQSDLHSPGSPLEPEVSAMGYFMVNDSFCHVAALEGGGPIAM
jgi:hypothetical protein